MTKTRTLVTGVSYPHLKTWHLPISWPDIGKRCRVVGSWALIWSKVCLMMGTKLLCWTVSGLAKPPTWNIFQRIRILN
jgi:hypothetical protein